MEWKAGACWVVVLPGVVGELVELLRATGVPVDPYKDLTLGGRSIDTVLMRLKRIRTAKMAHVSNGVQRELGVRELPEWAGALVQARAVENELLRTTEALIGLCEYALQQKLEVEILGQ
jgi:hypothetical protein